MHTAAATLATVGTRIDNGMWEQNNDDGWYHVTLPFDFNWFGTTERIITIGTNGVLTFGTAQLPYGSSEPVRAAVFWLSLRSMCVWQRMPMPTCGDCG